MYTNKDEKNTKNSQTTHLVNVNFNRRKKTRATIFQKSADMPPFPQIFLCIFMRLNI